MRFCLIAGVFGCALISVVTCNVVADTEQSQIQLEEVPQNVDQQEVPIAAEPLNEASSLQLQEIISKIPEIVNEAADGQMKSAETIENEDIIPEVVAVPKEMIVHNSREAKQLIGFIPTYVLRQAMLWGQNNRDDEFYDGSDEIEEERAIRRRKRFRKRNSRGHLKKSRRHKNTNKRRHNKRRTVSKKQQYLRNSMRPRYAPKKKNRRTMLKGYY